VSSLVKDRRRVGIMELVPTPPRSDAFRSEGNTCAKGLGLESR
jgi:hypothetical protein